jgi:hypothetical protein
MNSILLFLKSDAFLQFDAAFDPEQLVSMGGAFDQACAALIGDNAPAYREEIATRIVGLAKRGFGTSACCTKAR